MTWKSIILSILLTLFILFIAFLLLGYLSLKKSLPQETGSLRIDGLYANVILVRDKWGVPHIQAENLHDLCMASGFVSAQDRLFQMDFARRMALGRLAEIVGKEALPLDEMARTIGFRQIAARILQQMPSQSQDLLEAYAKGVNFLIQHEQKKLPIEFSLLKYTPEPWKPADSIVIIRLLAWILSIGWQIDPFYLELASKIEPDLLREITPVHYDWIPSQIHIQFEQNNSYRGNLLSLNLPALGSNAWALVGNRTTTGSPILANDTHLPFTVPNIFYILHWQTPEFMTMGLSIPGAPGILVGRNENIAWGFANGMIDDVDFFIEKIDPSDSNRYIYANKSYLLNTKVEHIKIKDNTTKEFLVRSTKNGPLVSHLKMIDSGDQTVSMRWTGFEISNEFEAIMKLAMARDFNDFSTALQSFKNPGLNFIYADKNGHIGHQLAAAIPERMENTMLFPLQAAAKSEWNGFFDYKSLPHQLDPQEGFVISANNRISSENVGYISCYWEPDYRYDRIKSLLDGLSKVSVDKAKEIQFDGHSERAKKLISVLLPGIKKEVRKSSSLHEYLVNLMENWDGNETSLSIASTVFHYYYLELLKATFLDELGNDLYKKFISLPNINFHIFDQMLLRQSSLFFDNITTPEIEQMQDITTNAFLSAVDSLQKKHDDPGQWQWGDMHKVTLLHPFGVNNVLGRFFNLGPFEAAGDNFTLNNATFSLASPFNAIVGPCMRQIADMSTMDYYVIITGGQSGQPLSEHYDDQLDLWKKGELVKFTLNDDIQSYGNKTLILIPNN